MTVHLSSTKGRSFVYHTDKDCAKLKGDTRPREKDTLDDRYRECMRCQGESYQNGGENIVCPYCEETVGRLHIHLPCEASP